MSLLLSQHLHDINRLPSEKGLLIFPISMTRIVNSQNAQSCWEYLQALVPKIHQTQGIGVVFIYSDYLYFHSKEPAFVLRTKHLHQMRDHKKQFQKILTNHPWYIASAFSYLTWGETLLANPDFLEQLAKLQTIYKKDAYYQELVRADIQAMKRDPDEEQNIRFVLEETLFLYFVSMGKIHLRNDYISGHEAWILNCYPGTPLRSQAYLYEQDFFHFSHSTNKYQRSFYDLSQKRLFSFSLDTKKVRQPQQTGVEILL